LAIPRLLTGDTNLIAKARTGTGKTAAFGLPIIQNIHEKCENVQALILEPTRELAMQTCTEFQSFTQGAYPRTTVLYGGASYSTQIKDLKRGCEIVVGTPGRVKDHIEKKTLDLSKIKYFILDEGDEMLDMGFIEDIEEIFKHANPDCRILLFSATMPSPILKIASEFMGEYEIIEEEGIIDEPLLIDQKYWVVKESEKIEALVRIIDMSPDFYGLVFTQTKMDADNVTKMLDLRGYSAAALHGDIMQNQREKVLERFRMKKTRILVATDVAARGIDITGLSHVVNYSLPFDGATYVHRIGRTGRAGSTGIAVTLVRPEERRKLGFLQSAITKASKGKMTEEKIPTIHDVLEIKQQRIIKTLQETLFTITSHQVQQEEFATSIPTEQITQETSEVQTIETKTPIEVSEFFANMAQDLCKEQDAQKVLAAVLATVYGEQLSPKHYGRISVQKDFGKQDDMSRIYVQLGKKDGLRPKDIAEFFSNMLHIPGRQVDQIDMAREFTLVSLPKASARKAIEMSKSNKKIPHMHYDVKDGMSRRQKAEDSKQRRKNSGEKKNVSDFVKNKDSNKKYESRKESRSKGNRPNVHVQTEQRKGAAKYKKSSKAERF
jgi:ATP-dependent RNA helicase DeaD